jgi:hypothetical protein
MSRPPRLHEQSFSCRGATAVELALVLPVLLMLVFGLVELSITVFQYNIVSQGARQAARLAIVRGELSGPELTPWGPPATTSPLVVEATAAGEDVAGEIARLMQPYLTGLDLTQTTITLSWPDGNNAIENRVTARVTTQHQPLLTFLFTTGWTLTGQSTLPIAH